MRDHKTFPGPLHHNSQLSATLVCAYPSKAKYVLAHYSSTTSPKHFNRHAGYREIHTSSILESTTFRRQRDLRSYPIPPMAGLVPDPTRRKIGALSLDRKPRLNTEIPRYIIPAVDDTLRLSTFICHLLKGTRQPSPPNNWTAIGGCREGARRNTGTGALQREIINSP
jgi:hypothetical protein